MSPTNYFTFHFIQYFCQPPMKSDAIHILNTKLIINSMGKVFVQYSSVLDGIWGQAKPLYIFIFQMLIIVKMVTRIVQVERMGQCIQSLMMQLKSSIIYDVNDLRRYAIHRIYLHGLRNVDFSTKKKRLLTARTEDMKDEDFQSL